MKVRTISQLPTADYNTIASRTAFLEASIKSDIQNDRYISRKVSISDINLVATTKLSNDLVSDYKLTKANGNKTNVRDIDSKLSALYNENVNINGIKTFNQFPQISAEFPTDDERYESEDNIVTNVKKVKNLVKDGQLAISTEKSLVAEGSPFKTYNGALTDYTGSSICYREFVDGDKFYYWKIDDGGTDSSKSVYDQIDGSVKHFVEIRDNGYLVVWGWLADGGSVRADSAWVGLFGQMKYEGDDTAIANVPLQIQPWIQGSKSTDMQYIGFGIPVRKGLQLNIRTGFPVRGGSNGAFQKPGSLTFQDGWIANSFVGYVIKNQE